MLTSRPAHPALSPHHVGRAARTLMLAAALVAAPASAQTPPDSTEDRGVRIGHGSRGVEIESADGRFLIQIQARLQFRLTGGSLGDTVLADRVTDGATLGINRARLKIGGHTFTPDLTWYFEYELSQSTLLDFRAQYRLAPWASLKVGQWKAQYSRERAISSGAQQLMDRSLINSFFTLDRQQGVSLYGRHDGGGLADFSYWTEILTGMGRLGGENDDNALMYMGRVQWNPFGDVVGFAGSDLEFRKEPSLGVAFGAVTNQSPYTRFSSSGGGQLPGFEDGESGQYRVNQWIVETAFKYSGVSWQQEFHWKQVNDAVADARTTLLGNYVQIGVLLGGVWPSLPKQLEVAVRHAFYEPDTEGPDDIVQEVSLNTNWFFNGHLNKLSAEVVWLTKDTSAGENDDSLNFRLQWDLSM